MKIYEAIAKANEILKENNIEDYEIKSKEIMKSYLNYNSSEMIIHNNDYMNDDFKKYFEKIYMLCENIPYQYILNEAYFYGNKYYVDENVLIPRMDSEILVSEVMKKISELEKNTSISNISVLEIGSGSGALAITIAKNYDCKILSVDISEKALEVSKKNRKMHNIPKEKLEFRKSNIFANVDSKFDIIFSNPPYIRTDEIAKLDKEVQKEPYIALDGGKDGLDYYNSLIRDCKKYLKNSDSYILFEIGFDQKKSVTKILKENGFKNISCIQDLENRDRVVIAKNN